MDAATLKSFFGWCTLINGGLFAFWAIFVKLAPDLVYRTQKTWVDISRETFHLVVYCLLGVFKIVFLVFNVVPYIVLSILQ